jgi:hypothetical protein
VSNIAIRANNQFPWPDFHRLDKQPYRLRTKDNVFAGQVLALQLNVTILGGGLGSFVLPSGPAAGKTVAQVLADANAALGCGTLPSYVSSISDLNDIVDSINEMFDKG